MGKHIFITSDMHNPAAPGNGGPVPDVDETPPDDDEPRAPVLPTHETHPA